MLLSRFTIVACVALLFVLPSFGDLPRSAKNPARNGDDLPGDQWSVEFANGVVETVVIGRSGAAYVAEPRRISSGKVIERNVAFVIAFDDDRVERWTPVGKRMVVEHWFPGNTFPNGTPVRGIAERSPTGKPIP